MQNEPPHRSCPSLFTDFPSSVLCKNRSGASPTASRAAQSDTLNLHWFERWRRQLLCNTTLLHCSNQGSTHRLYYGTTYSLSPVLCCRWSGVCCLNTQLWRGLVWGFQWTDTWQRRWCWARKSSSSSARGDSTVEEAISLSSQSEARLRTAYSCSI